MENDTFLTKKSTYLKGTTLSLRLLCYLKKKTIHIMLN